MKREKSRNETEADATEGEPRSRVRRILAAGIALLLCAGPMGAWAAEGAAATPGKLRVLCSVFPVYQFTRNVTAGRAGAEVELMLPPALGCPHDYLLTPQDMTKIARADVFVANGLGLEEFLGAPLQRANPKLLLIDASAGIKDVIAQGEAGHEHGGVNPHLFASPAMAAKMVMNIAEGLAKADPQAGALYRKNAEVYAARLSRLAEDIAAAVKGLRTRKIVTTHGVFDYLARHSGLEVVAVIEETPGQEPSASRMLELVRRIKASGAGAVFTEPQYPAAVGETIAREAGIPVATLDPVASGPVGAPLDYYETVMRKNIETLRRVLGK